MNNKTLYIIAGPNGGGKSTYSKDIAPKNIRIFDGDALFKEYSKYCDEDYLAWERVYDFFEEQIDNSIRNNLDFVYESNFFQEDSIKIPQKFKDAGYNIECHFISLSSSIQCVHRVAERVKLGGHSVPEYQILKRYEGGLKNLIQYYNYFDRLIIYNNDTDLKSVLHLEKNVITYIDTNTLIAESDISKTIYYIQAFITKNC